MPVNPTTEPGKPEDIADIAAEMRREGRTSFRWFRDRMESYADRLDAAVEREKYRDTIYAGRDGEMTLDECIVRCDNNSGDDPRGRDIAQIGSWLRELRALRTAPGNAAATRAALSDANLARARGNIDDAVSDCNAALSRKTCEEKDIYIRNAKSAASAAWDNLDAFIRAALAAPPRNCDVGTAKEQAVRKAKYCHRYSPLPTDNCDNCPLRGYNLASPERAIGYSCDLAWGQLPYTPAEGDKE